MAKHRKVNKRAKFSVFLILICIILILASIYVIWGEEYINTSLKPNTRVLADGTEIVVSETANMEEIGEEAARKVAKSQFRLMGEKGLWARDLNVTKIERSGEEYYYITSKKNTLELKIIGGQITRINSVPVQ